MSTPQQPGHEPGPDDAPVHPLFVRWARFVLRFRWLCLAATFGSTGWLVYQAATRLQTDNSVEAFLSNHSEAAVWLEQLRDDFGRDEMFMVLVSGDVFSPRYLDRLKKLHDELAVLDLPLASLGKRRAIGGAARPDAPAVAAMRAKPKPAAPSGFDDFEDHAGDEGWGAEAGGTLVDEITSLVNVRETTWKDGGLHVGGLLDDWPSAAQLPALKKRVLSERSMVGRVVDPQGKHSLIMFRTDFMDEKDLIEVHEAIEKICAKHRAPGFELRLAGLPALEVSLNKLMLSDLSRLAGGAVVLMLLIMTYLFRHPIGVLGPVLVVVMSVQWTFGLMALMGKPMTMLTNILPAFISCVAIGDSVHIQAVYRELRRYGMGNHEAIVRAVGATGIPVLFTTLTTCMGLWSFRYTSAAAIQDMGTYGAFGVAVALVHTLVTVPCLLSFHRHGSMGARAAHDRTDFVDRMIVFCDGLSKPRPGDADPRRRLRRTNMVAAALAALALVGMLGLRVYHNPLSWIPDDFPIKDAFDTLDESMGGTADLALMIEAKPGKTLRNRDLMLALDKLEAHIRAYKHPEIDPLVGNAVSILDVLRESNRATHESDPRYYAIPDSERGVADMLTLFESAGPEQLRRLATIDLQHSVMTIRVKWLDATAYAPLTEHIRAGIDAYVGDLATVKPTGSVFNVLTVVRGLLHDLMNSFGSALVVITLMMIVLVWDIKLGLISMLPNLLPIAVLVGGMGYLNVPIDMANLVIAAVAMGVAVDDTIHFIHQFRSHYRQHGDTEAAIAHCFEHAGRAMVFTSVILVAGFSVFAVADMYSVQRFGILIASTTALALFADLIFTPACLRTFYGKPARSKSSNPGDHDASTSHTA